MVRTGEPFPEAILIQLPFLSKVVAFQTSCIPIQAIAESENAVLILISANWLGYEGIDPSVP